MGSLLPISVTTILAGITSAQWALPLSAESLLDQSIQALGGASALQAIQGISYHHFLYRTQSLEESKVPGVPDTAVATAGSETISYDFSGNSTDVVQRIDRNFDIGNFWTWGRAGLDPSDVTLIVRGGDDGYSCYNKGNEHITLPAAQSFGYTDGFLTGVLVRDALRLSPKLLLQMRSNTRTISSLETTYRGTGPFKAVHDSSTNIMVVFDPDTSLPYLIRAYEDHSIFGNSTNDFVLLNYTDIQGIMIPRLVQTVYNEDSLLLYTLRDNVTTNPMFPAGFFEGLPVSQIGGTYSGLPPRAAEMSTEYGTAEVFENNGNLIWYGPSMPSLETLTVTQPVPGLPNIYHLAFADSFYSHTVGVFDNAVMVTDAAPHQSKVVIQWINEVLHRDVTHLLVTHHHHDHNYGAADFVAAGAKLVVPEEFTYYWKNIPGVKFATVTEDKPFKYKDSNMQIRAIWHREVAHSDDWMYFVWTEACPGEKSVLVSTVADAWSPGFVGFEFDEALAVNYLALARKDHMPYNYTVIPIHGVPTPVAVLYDLVGYAYPNYTTRDFLPGGPLC